MPFDLPEDARFSTFSAAHGGSGSVGVLDQLRAAFSRENTVSAALDLIGAPRFEPDFAFDPVAQLTDQELVEAPFLAQALSADHLAFLRQKLDQEKEVRRRIDEGPLPSILVELTAGLVDPVNLLPLGWARTPAKLALGVAGTVAASEAVLQADQLTRSKAESVAAIAMGGALGYGLGYVARVLGAKAASSYDAAVKSLAGAIVDTARDLDAAGAGTLSAARAGFTSPLTAEATTPLAKGLGPVLTKLSDWGLASPGAALAFSEDPLVRRLAHQLVDTGIYTEGMSRGVTMGQSLDTRVRARKSIFQMALQDIVESGFAEYRRAAGGKATREAFFDEVFMALREGDVHANPAVERTARAIRSGILAPLGKEAKEQGLIVKLLFGDEGVDPGRAGYVPQRILAHKVNANLADFRARVAKHISAQIEEVNAKVRRAAEARAEADQIKAALEERLAQLKTAREAGAEGAARVRKVVRPVPDAQRGQFAKELSAIEEERVRLIDASVSERAKFTAAVKSVEKLRSELDAVDTELAQVREAIANSPDERRSAANRNLRKRETALLKRRGVIEEKIAAITAEVGDEAALEARLAPIRERLDEILGRKKEIDRTLREGVEVIDIPGDVASIRAVTLEERLAKSSLSKAIGNVQDIKSTIASNEKRLAAVRKQLDDWRKRAETDDVVRRVIPKVERVEQRIVDRIERLKTSLADAEKAVEQAKAAYAEIVAATDERLAPAQKEAAAKVEAARKEAARLEAQRQLIWLDLKMWREEQAARMRLYGQDPANWDPTGTIREQLAALERRLEEHTKLQRAQRAEYRAALKEARGVRAIPRDEAAKLEAEVARLEELLKAKEEVAREAERLAGDLEELDPQEGLAAVDDFITRLNKTDYSRYQEFRVKFGNLKERSITVPPDILRDYGDTDVFNVLSAYINGVVTDIETQKMFGWLDPPEGVLDNPFEEIIRAAQKRAEAETDPDKARAIIERASKDVDTLQELLRRVRGANASRIPPSMMGLSRAAEQARNWNFMRLMGSSVLSNLPDFARVAAAHGFRRALGTLLPDMLRGFKSVRLAKQDARKLGVAVETVLNHRMRAIESLDETYRGRTRVEAFLSKRMTPAVAYLTLQPQWTDAMKAIDSMLTVDMLLGIADDLTSGKLVAPARMRELARVGLDREWAERIKAIPEAWSVVDGLRQLDIERVRAVDPELADQTIYALHQHVNDTVISPGVGDIPAWMDRTDLGRTVSQFKRWVVAGQTRILVRLIQTAAAKEYGTVAAHVTGLLVLGMLSTALRDIAADGRVDDRRPVNGWIWSGMDRSGMLGLFAEVDAMVGMTTGWNAARVIGGNQLSRYRERTALDQALGPTAGLIDDTLKAISRLTDGSIDLKDAQAVRRLAPLQNWFAINYLLDVATGKQARDDERAGLNEPRLTRSAMQ